MKINNFTQFYNLLVDCGLQGKNSILQDFSTCAEEWKTNCNCGGKTLKNCNIAYVNIVSSTIQEFMPVIFEKTGSNSIEFLKNENHHIRTFIR